MPIPYENASILNDVHDDSLVRRVSPNLLCMTPITDRTDDDPGAKMNNTGMIDMAEGRPWTISTIIAVLEDARFAVKEKKDDSNSS